MTRSGAPLTMRMAGAPGVSARRWQDMVNLFYTKEEGGGGGGRRKEEEGGRKGEEGGGIKALEGCEARSRTW